MSAGEPRYCTHHQGKAPVAGGKRIVSTNGRSRRWLCAACAERRKAK